jgi:hypothetical protein
MAQPDIRLLTEYLQGIVDQASLIPNLPAFDGQALLRRFETLERGIHAQQIEMNAQQVENRRFQERILESLDRLISHSDARYGLQSKLLSELIRLR